MKWVKTSLNLSKVISLKKNNNKKKNHTHTHTHTYTQIKHVKACQTMLFFFFSTPKKEAFLKKFVALYIN